MSFVEQKVSWKEVSGCLDKFQKIAETITETVPQIFLKPTLVCFKVPPNYKVTACEVVYWLYKAFWQYLNSESLYPGYPANYEEGSGRTTTLLVFLLGEKIIDNQAE